MKMPFAGEFVLMLVSALATYAAEPTSLLKVLNLAAASPVERTISDTQLAQLEKERPHTGDALLELALAYDERHDRRAADIYRTAASQGVAVAELRLGALYEKGEGVTQSYTEARDHYLRAVELGAPEANLRLGLLYLEGWGVPRDPAISVARIEQAATAGYPPAQQVLSDMFFAGVGVTADLPKALHWAEQAASDRNPAAQTSVGAIRAKAVKMPQDLAVARDWFQLSAEQDYSRGMLLMAGTFLRPNASADDVQLGLRWLDLAAEAGNGAAAFHRAGFYLMNPWEPATAEIEQRARALLEISANAGEPAAAEVLEAVNGGQPLVDAFRFIVTVPYEDRYVQRLAPNGPVAPNEDRVPRPIKITRPVYPAALRIAGTQGQALVEFVVDTTGRVQNPHAVSSTHPGFAAPSTAVILNWRFEPGYKAGRPVNTRVRIPIHFWLSDVGDVGSARGDPQQPGI